MTRWLGVLILPLSLALACNSEPKATPEAEETETKAAESPQGAAEAPAASQAKRPTRPGKPEIEPPEDVGKPPEDAKKTDSGVAYVVLEPSTGIDAPRAFDEVEMEYVLWASEDGQMFDRSREGKPSKLFVHQLMPGFGEVVTDMKVGEKRRAWIPAKLAFGDTPGFPQGDMTLEVKLLGVRRVPEPPPVPEDVGEVPKDAQKTASGLATKVLEKGTGKESPEENDTVEVHYTGWTTDGRMFDSSVVRGEPMRFGVTKVIPGWSEGVQLMVEGEKRRMWIPEDLAYKGRPGAPKGMLVFDVELLEIQEAPEPPETPKNVAAPPEDAEKTESGLASKVLKEGSGDEHPGPTSKVQVHYTGWTTDGKMFDSSVTRGRPLTFSLNQVIPGWTEGVQLMVEGEKRRMWIPEELAYKGRPGAPQGMLVFNVELLKILD